MTVLVVAETGLNHNGDTDLAHQMVDAAADAGADAVKFQCYRTEDFIQDRTLTYQGRPQYEMFKQHELPDWAWPELQAHCRDRGVVFFATPTSVERLDLLVELGVPMLKNGSDYLGHLPLIEAMAKTGLATIISTGMATEAEIDAAVNTFDEAGGEDLTLMHCTSVYPTPPADVNLRRIQTLAECYGVPVGFSDHTNGTRGNTAAVGAVILGARIVEKHFTLDNRMPGPDHHLSVDPLRFGGLVWAIHEAETMLGTPTLGPTESEQESRRWRVTEVDGQYLRR